MNNYHKIAQLGRLSAMEKVGVRAAVKALGGTPVPKPVKLSDAVVKGSSKPHLDQLKPAGPSPLPAGSPMDIPRIRQRHNVGKVTTMSGELKPELKVLADRMGIPHDEYLTMLKGYTAITPATAKEIRSALLGGGATIGAIGGAAYMGKADWEPRDTVGKAQEAIPKTDGLQKLIGSMRKPSKYLPHQDYPVP